MFIRLTPVIAIVLLSGCTLTKGEQYHQETLAAIQSSQTKLDTSLTNIESQMMARQAEDYKVMQEKISDLTIRLDTMQAQLLTELKKTQAAPVAPVPVAVVAAKPTHEVVLGEIERVTIDSIDQTFDARVDTGAATSSLNAVDIEEFERDGKNWVRFHLSDGAATPAESNWIEAPIVRFVKIRQSTNEEVERRAVVELWVKVGSIHEKTQFTLADRSQMSHPVLLGREFIRDIAVVDVSKKYIHTDEPTKK
ncbi:ATP-dependent Zn protease [Vibrio sinensis]|uniref:ATP-dependent Zn protease n=1 Tax=Vibrio sinensis TaxID=2302434 RepID=A0A3A6QR49_9VIBR|nr:ATP-dependent zinc protease [Vibrio sinensis]RJX73748.1 ATP-dependent Zn protease [Vibrio sinensis]